MGSCNTAARLAADSRRWKFLGGGSRRPSPTRLLPLLDSISDIQAGNSWIVLFTDYNRYQEGICPAGLGALCKVNRNEDLITFYVEGDQENQLYLYNEQGSLVRMSEPRTEDLDGVISAISSMITEAGLEAEDVTFSADNISAPTLRLIYDID